jgi:hypothetical protein
MRKVFLLQVFILIVYVTFGQHVGVNKTNPSEALDVNGNIALNGTIKVNGDAGTAGAVLTSNGAGGIGWQPAGGAAFSRMRVFNSSVLLQHWNVPAGVTRIMVEGWTGGGTAVQIGGQWFSGGSGAYIKGIVEVTPGTSITIKVPYAQTTYNIVDSLHIVFGANTLKVNNANGPNGGTLATNTGVFGTGVLLVEGADGERESYTHYMQMETVDVLTTFTTYPAGADAPFGGRGGRKSFRAVRRDNGVMVQHSGATHAKSPGGGAAVGVSMQGSISSMYAGAGKLVIWY